MNHFLYATQSFGIEYPNTTYINTTNAPSGSGVGNLGDAANACAGQYGRAPTYLLVDFATAGNAIATVDRLNGVTNPVGRTTVGQTIPSSTSTASGSNVPFCSGSLALSVLLAVLLVLT